MNKMKANILWVHEMELIAHALTMAASRHRSMEKAAASKRSRQLHAELATRMELLCSQLLANIDDPWRTVS